MFKLKASNEEINNNIRLLVDMRSQTVCALISNKRQDVYRI